MWKIVKVVVLVVIAIVVIAVLGDDELRASIKDRLSGVSGG